MSIRGPKSVKLYHNGELCAEMESVKATIDLLVLHDPLQRSWSRVKKLFKEARRNNTALFGFTFVEDPDWIPSRAVMATDVETNETFVKESVSEMSRIIFGPSFKGSNSRITELCRNGKSYRGLILNYVNENDIYSVGYGNAGDDYKKPVQQLDIAIGFVINDFPSITHAARYIWKLGVSSASSISNIRNIISACVNGNPRLNGIYLGYRWQFTNPQHRP